MGAKVQGPDGKDHLVSMGSYGIGPSRVVAAIIEASHDDDGIVWPQSAAPFDLAIINMKAGDSACDAVCEPIYHALTKAGRDVLYDDSAQSAGAKFATHDLVGLPWQIIAGPRGVAAGTVEVKNRKTGARENLSPDEAINRFAGR
jgi:prolyl-tRNA synthetase